MGGVGSKQESFYERGMDIFLDNTITTLSLQWFSKYTSIQVKLTCKQPLVKLKSSPGHF